MLHRFIPLQVSAMTRLAQGGDLVIDMAFSSELPYERWWGIEILDHSDGSVDLTRLNDGASVFFNHDPNELRGVHVRGSVAVSKDKVLRGKVQLTSVTQAGRDAIGLVESGTLSKASIGYQIDKVIEQSTSKGKAVERELDGALFDRVMQRHANQSRGDLATFRRELDAAAGAFERASDEPTVYRVVKWTPYENSLVTIPADPTVGVGRSAEQFQESGAAVAASSTAKPAITKGAKAMDTNASAAAGNADVVVVDQPKIDPVAMEKLRRRGIENLCKANKIDDGTRDHWIGSGASMDVVAEQMLGIMEERGRENPQSAAKLGLSKKEIKQFSLCRAIDACGSRNWAKAGFEAECSGEISKRLGRLEADQNRFFVPLELQVRENRTPVEDLAYALLKRDLTSGTGSAGGFLVETSNIGFIEMLRNRSVIMAMGARRLTGLQGNVAIPKQTVAATAVWLANEASTVTESQQTFAQVALTPKTVGGYTEISRLLLLQSNPSAEGLVMSDLSQVVALAVDLAGLTGSGAAGQPTGIINTAGIGGVTGTAMAYAGIIEFQTDVATGNALTASCGYVATPVVAGLLKQRVKFTNSSLPLWDGQLLDANCDGYRGMASNQVPTGDLLFGDFGQVIVGEWGVLELEVNPYANFQAGIVGVRALYSIDIGVRIPAAFSLATSVT